MQDSNTEHCNTEYFIARAAERNSARRTKRLTTAIIFSK